MITTGVCTVVFAEEFYSGHADALAPYVMNFVAFGSLFVTAIVVYMKRRAEITSSAAAATATAATATSAHSAFPASRQFSPPYSRMPPMYSEP
jgi:fructose-1-phosphate kinase PfkB-like protein